MSPVNPAPLRCRLQLALVLAMCFCASCSTMPPVEIEASRADMARSFLRRPENRLRQGISFSVEVHPGTMDAPKSIDLEGEEDGRVIYRPRPLLANAAATFAEIYDAESRSVEAQRVNVLLELVYLRVSMQPGGGGDRNPYTSVGLRFSLPKHGVAESRVVECLLTAQVGPAAYWADPSNRWNEACVVRGGKSLFFPTQRAKALAVNDAVNSTVLLTLFWGIRELQREFETER